MKSRNSDILPATLRRALAKLGGDLKLARRKRLITGAAMAERLGVGRTTYLRAEHGDPRVAMGVYAMALFVLGLGDRLDRLADPGTDERGLLLDDTHVPQRVRARKEPVGL
jgi:transcriptional regulator with XRE-family HTH domain